MPHLPRSDQSAAPAQPTGELVFRDSDNARELARRAKSGQAVRLAPGVYVDDASLPGIALARHHLYAVAAHFWPGAVVCDRSALAGGRAGEWLFLCHPDPPRQGDLHLPGVSVTCRVGPGPLPGDMTFPEGLHLSGTARGLCENIATAGRPAAGRPARQAGEAAVGDRVDDLARSGQSGKVTAALEQLNVVADHFAPATVEKVRSLLVAALGTVSDATIASARLAARVSGTPYDAARLMLFERLREEIEALAPKLRPARLDPSEQQWLPFFEAYFSNYIEGTRFSVEEAHDIAIKGLVPANRPQDAHDVSATFAIVSDPELMREIPHDANTFLDLLQARHLTLMAGRSEVHPGEFKTRPNFAGGTAFVSPDVLLGTLRAAWEHIDSVVDPFSRAVMMMFVVTECHPFDDGNGRIARILTNAELAARDQARVIIPNCFRGNYLTALTGATANANGRALVASLDFTRRWVQSVDWHDWDRCMADLHASHAFLDSFVAERSGDTLRILGTF